MVSSKDQRIANRLRVLQTWVLHPEWHGTRIGKEAGGVSEATVRGIIKRYGPEFKAGLALQAPSDKKRSGRPIVRTLRWQRYVPNLPTHLPIFRMCHRHLVKVCQKPPSSIPQKSPSDDFRWKNGPLRARMKMF